MPVVVRGNLESGILILFLHGGPGGTSLKKLEREHLIHLKKIMVLCIGSSAAPTAQ